MPLLQAVKSTGAWGKREQQRESMQMRLVRGREYYLLPARPPHHLGLAVLRQTHAVQPRVIRRLQHRPLLRGGAFVRLLRPVSPWMEFVPYTSAERVSWR